MSDNTGANANSNGAGMPRREFLQTSALGVVGWAMPNLMSAAGNSGKSCILVFNGGGLSHLDSWDPKPDAPREIRSPFGAIPTRGDFQISSLFPQHASVADKFSIVRSVFHRAAALHDVGSQLTQTGRLNSGGVRFPHVGCVIDFLTRGSSEVPAHVLLGGSIAPPGEADSYGQDAGFLGSRFAPSTPTSQGRLREAIELGKESMRTRERYGMHRLGQRFLVARRLIERGVRFVTLNTSSFVSGETTWDIHGGRPYGTIEEMRSGLAPMYDQACSALVEELAQRGLLDSTLVAALSEFGRTPLINADGGREHWSECWSVCFAGGGVKGGRAIGRSDEIGSAPVECPVEPRNIMATIYKALGVDRGTMLPGPDGVAVPVVDPGTRAIEELF